MKEKFITFLTGISALIAVGFLCITPSNVACAAGDSLTSIDVYDNNPTLQTMTMIGSTPGSVTITCPDIPNISFNGGYAMISVYPDNSKTIYITANYNADISAENASGTATFSFDYDGNSYSGTMTLICESRSVTDLGCEMPLSSFMAGNNSSSNEETGPVAEFKHEVENKIVDIEKAVQGINSDGTTNVTKTVEYSSVGALDGSIMNAMSKADGVTLFYTFTYQGIIFRSAITSDAAAFIYTKNINWYGPCFLADNFPTVIVGVL